MILRDYEQMKLLKRFLLLNFLMKSIVIRKFMIAIYTMLYPWVKKFLHGPHITKAKMCVL